MKVLLVTFLQVALSISTCVVWKESSMHPTLKDRAVLFYLLRTVQSTKCCFY